MARGSRDRIDEGALSVPETVVAHTMFGFEMADDRLDGGVRRSSCLIFGGTWRF